MQPSAPNRSPASCMLQLSDDLLRHALLPASEENIRALVALASTCSSLQQRLAEAVRDMVASLPPPYPGPAALDKALASGDAQAARPLLVEAMRRLAYNIALISQRLRDRGYPLVHKCDLTGQPLGTPVEDLESLLAPLRERGVAVPLALEEFWRQLGGVALGSPDDAAHAAWWREQLPGADLQAADPLWIDHAAAVIGDANPLFEMTLANGFSAEHGFSFRTAPVLHLAPDAYCKNYARHSNAAGVGSYAVWLEAQPSLDPELLRFEPPAWADTIIDGSISSEPEANPVPSTGDLWRSCSLVTYLRLAVLQAGGFPGAMGVPEFEPLRLELCDGLKNF